MNYQLLPKLEYMQGTGAAPLLAQQSTSHLINRDYSEIFSFSCPFQHPPAPALYFALECQQQSRWEAVPAKEAEF